MAVVTADLSRPICALPYFGDRNSLALLSIPFPGLARIPLWCVGWICIGSEMYNLCGFQVAVTVLSQEEIHLPKRFLEGERTEDVIGGH